MRKISLIICVLFLSFNSFAQEEEVTKKSSYFGVRAGLNFLKGSNYENHSSDLGVGYQIGGLVNLPLGKSNFSFQPEVLYMKVNSNETDVEKGYSDVQVTRLKEYSSNILLFPLNFRYLIKDKVGIEIGPSLGYNFSSIRNVTETYYEYATGDTSSFSYESKSDSKNKFAALLNFGVDYNITNKFNVGFKYNYAFGGTEPADKLMDNSVFSINLGYNFIK
ncbi:porin family protein [Flavobacterium terrigena]|uniref:Outer membrane protein beta-barrel domain-containing protein n=1 Tax=Flavobacterium terrigena TaxID=402734 RepID=A0A1H6Q2D6_9FLAO|nr:porin family protein [Flavobacterium terrigena]SEI38009.1 Outer membrane protein beta-barrel domain-containing protein [Flavobacterium terrigena]